MGEYIHSSKNYNKPILWALQDVFTPENFFIGLFTGIMGYGIFEFLRRKL